MNCWGNQKSLPDSLNYPNVRLLSWDIPDWKVGNYLNWLGNQVDQVQAGNYILVYYGNHWDNLGNLREEDNLQDIQQQEDIHQGIRQGQDTRRFYTGQEQDQRSYSRVGGMPGEDLNDGWSPDGAHYPGERLVLPGDDQGDVKDQKTDDVLLVGCGEAGIHQGRYISGGGRGSDDWVLQLKI